MADIEIRQESPTAFYIKVHQTDNVAIIVNDRGLKAGTRFPDGLTLIEHIPQGHKVALIDIPVRGEIIRYGEVIGYAVRDIPQGSWIEESLVELPKAPPLNTLPLANKVPEPLPALTGYTFEGYRNADGSVGTRNLLGITTSVHCVAGVVDYVVKIIERDLLPKYPSIDGVTGIGLALVKRGYTGTEAGEIIGQSVANACPEYRPLLQRFVAIYGTNANSKTA